MRISTEVPLDRTAALVVSKGFQYTTIKQFDKGHSELPFAIKEIPAAAWNNRAFTDLTGMRLGYLTVLGMARDFKGRWVVRCKCGRYELRRAGALLNPKEETDQACKACQYVDYLKTKHRKTGADAPLLEK